MGQKLSSLVFNGPRAKTKTVLEMAYKMDPKSSIIQSVSARWCRLSLASVVWCSALHTLATCLIRAKKLFSWTSFNEIA